MKSELDKYLEGVSSITELMENATEYSTGKYAELITQLRDFLVSQLNSPFKNRKAELWVRHDIDDFLKPGENQYNKYQSYLELKKKKFFQSKRDYIAELCLSLDTALGYWLFKGFVFIYIVQPSGVDLNTAEMIDVRTTESEEFFIKSIENLIKS